MGVCRATSTLLARIKLGGISSATIMNTNQTMNADTNPQIWMRRNEMRRALLFCSLLFFHFIAGYMEDDTIRYDTSTYDYGCPSLMGLMGPH